MAFYLLSILKDHYEAAHFRYNPHNKPGIFALPHCIRPSKFSVISKNARLFVLLLLFLLSLLLSRYCLYYSIILFLSLLKNEKNGIRE